MYCIHILGALTLKKHLMVTNVVVNLLLGRRSSELMERFRTIGFLVCPSDFSHSKSAAPMARWKSFLERVIRRKLTPRLDAYAETKHGAYDGYGLWLKVRPIVRPTSGASSQRGRGLDPQEQLTDCMSATSALRLHKSSNRKALRVLFPGQTLFS